MRLNERVWVSLGLLEGARTIKYLFTLASAIRSAASDEAILARSVVVVARRVGEGANVPGLVSAL